MRDAPKTGRLASITQITTLVTLISLVVGIAIGVQQLVTALQSATETLSAVKLQALPQMREIIERDLEIHQQIAGYLGAELGSDVEYVEAEIQLGTSGEMLFFSGELRTYREICEHYQTLGALVELGYLPFDLVFEVITFPDRFWSQSTELRNALGSNWQQPDVPLTDFMRTMAALSKRYQARRAELEYRYDDPE